MWSLVLCVNLNPVMGVEGAWSGKEPSRGGWGVVYLNVGLVVCVCVWGGVMFVFASLSLYLPA